MPNTEENSRVIAFIGAFKLLKAALLICAGLGTLEIIHGDAQELIDRVLRQVPLAPAHAAIQRLLGRVGLLTERQLDEIAFGTFAYAAVFLVEGIGLLRRRTWAEWLTVIVTASFIPLEAVHMGHEPGAGKALAIALNAAIVVYLIARIIRRRRSP
jgi:uncharacterized membrane protein (DUF2068 family)